jgi:hypothetical protein
MTSHLALLILFSALVSIVFAALLRETVDAQLKLAGQLFAGFLVAAIALGWLMYPFPI